MKVIIYKDFKDTEKCRLFIAREPFSTNQRYAFAAIKSDSMVKALNNECDPNL